MFIIAISFNRREYQIVLYKNLVYVDKVTSSNASKNLMLCIDSILERNSLTLDDVSKVGFLSGPGSFTSARILCATCLGLKLTYDKVLFVPVLINEAIHSVENCAIVMQCNMLMWHLFIDNQWKLVNIDDLLQMEFEKWTSVDDIDLKGNKIEWPNLSYCIAKYCDAITEQKDLMPFYGY